MKALFGFLLLPVLALSQSVLPLGSTGNSANIQSDARSSIVGLLNVTPACYGTNNRSTTNPISPDGMIYVHILSTHSKKGAIVKFPGALTKQSTNTNFSTSYTCGVAYATEAEINAKNPTVLTYTSFDCSTQNVSVGITSSLAKDGKIGTLKAFSYQDLGSTSVQNFYGGTGVMGEGTKHDNLASSTVQSKTGALLESISLTVDYPGQDGFCGGYHSPLMFFFSSKYPEFTGKTKFLLKSKGGGITSWVEKNHAGYFLAELDVKNPEKGIYKAEQLFGDEKYFANGFSNLTLLDSNKDNVINSKDSGFSRLVLWKDKNGNGKSDKGELIKLSKKGIKEISLSADLSYNKLFGNKASASGKSTFRYIASGKEKTGTILDIYFREN